MKESIRPPIAKVIPHKTVMHGEELIDNYNWLKDKTRSNPEVLEYIRAENEYTERMLAQSGEVQDKLYSEMLSKVDTGHISFPVKADGYYYYSREIKGKRFPIHCRRKGSMEAAEQVILDVNEFADDHEYCEIWLRKTSPNHRILAFTADTTGSEDYALYFKNLETGEILDERIYPVTFWIVWANDSRTLFYTKRNENGLTDKLLYRHTLGKDPKDDELIYREDDDSFYVAIRRTKSRKYLIVTASNYTTSEVRYLKADDPHGEFRLVHPRHDGLVYDVYHHGDKFFIRTNDEGAKNYKVMVTPVDNPGKENWEEFIGHRDNVSLVENRFEENLEIFKDYMVIIERHNGLRRVRVVDLNRGSSHVVEFPEEAYSIDYDENPDFDTYVFGFLYRSFTTPDKILHLDMRTGKIVSEMEQASCEGYDASQYRSERVWAEAKDGTKIPISLVYRGDLFRGHGQNPLLLYVYGSNGRNLNPRFLPTRLSLLDRGFVWAYAHVRGGGELGRVWHEQGKMFEKKKTFTDLIACAEHLIREGYTSKDKLVLRGRSAGGLAVGAATNMRPDLFRAVIADVPVLDLLNRALDPSVSGVVALYDEWGDPHDKTLFDYMKSYCPYQNLKAQKYPHILVEAGFHDPRVNYWGPAKWTAKLRALKTDNNLLLSKTDMKSGHGGFLPRSDDCKKKAFEYAFILNVLAIEG